MATDIAVQWLMKLICRAIFSTFIEKNAYLDEAMYRQCCCGGGDEQSSATGALRKRQMGK
jgi:hypothetical protein